MGSQLVRDILRGRGLSTWKNYGTDRGMSAWNDLIDWVGGYPFEVAKPEEILIFFQIADLFLKIENLWWVGAVMSLYSLFQKIDKV